jgi:acetyltransferase-like isoleucine patch superfamily enzyme
MPPDHLKVVVRTVEAVHGRKEVAPDPAYVDDLAANLKNSYGRGGLERLYSRFSAGDSFLDALMRRVILKGLARSCGNGLDVGSAVGFKHSETFEIGHGVFVGAQAYIQGRFDGTCVIGNHVWIGPQAYFDARDLVIEEFVGWGPGAKVLGSTHSGMPLDLPVISTQLRIRPVRIGAWADVGTNATILPGVTVGKGALVGAGAVVIADVEPFSVVAGVPARFVRWRSDSDPSPQDSRTAEKTDEE